MAKLPSDSDFGQISSPVSNRPIATYDTSAEDKGIAALGQGIEKLGEGISLYQKQQTHEQTTEATAEFLAGKVSEDARVLTDPDYTTLQDKTSSNLNQLRETAASKIMDPKAREHWLATIQPQFEHGIKNAEVQAFKLSSDANKAYLGTFGEDLIKKSMMTADPVTRTGAIDAYGLRVDSLIQQRQISAVQGMQFKRAFAQQYATADAMRRMDQGDWSVLDEMRNARPQPGATPTPEQYDQIKGKANVAKPSEFWGDPSKPDFAQNHLVQIQLNSGKTVTVNKAGALPFQGFLNELEANGYKIDSIGGYNDRKIFGTGIDSQHRYGNAVDINPGRNPVTRGVNQTDLPPNVSEIAAKYGISWGGDWKSKKDPMHFEYTGVQPGDQPKETQVADASGAMPGMEANAAQPPSERSIYGVLQPMQLEQLLQRAERMKGAALIDQNRQDAIAKRQAQIVSDQAEDGILKQIYADPSKVTALDIVKNDNLTREAKERLPRVLAQATAKDHDASTYGKDFIDLFRRVHAEPTDPSRLTDPAELYQYVGKGLSLGGMEKLRQEILGKRTPDGSSEGEVKKQFLVNAHRQLSGKDVGFSGMQDPKGEELYLQFLQGFLPAYDKARAEGKTPTQLLNPKSPDYLGKPIEDMKRDPAVWFSDMMKAGPAAEAAKPFDIGSIKTLEDAQAAFKSGQISAAQGRALAIERGWARPRPEPAALPQVPRF